MAVYTKVDDHQLRDFLALYDVGTPTGFKGIAEGVENSNYLLKTKSTAYILTLFEKRVAAEDLPFFLGLMDHAASQGVPSARPIAQSSGDLLGQLCNKPAALIEFLDGVSTDRPNPAQAKDAGAALAQFHQAAATFPKSRANQLGHDVWQSMLTGLKSQADELESGLGAELAEATDRIIAGWPTGLPTGIIHADLFPDNVLFLGDEVSGLIDFYFSCTDTLAYDLAVMINAWCFDAEGNFLPDIARAIVSGYQTKRSLSDGEARALPFLAQGAAMRFILTRLHDWFQRDPLALVMPKDPLALLPNLRFHLEQSDPSVYGV